MTRGMGEAAAVVDVAANRITGSTVRRLTFGDHDPMSAAAVTCHAPRCEMPYRLPGTTTVVRCTRASGHTESMKSAVWASWHVAVDTGNRVVATWPR